MKSVISISNKSRQILILCAAASVLATAPSFAKGVVKSEHEEQQEPARVEHSDSRATTESRSTNDKRSSSDREINNRRNYAELGRLWNERNDRNRQESQNDSWRDKDRDRDNDRERRDSHFKHYSYNYTPGRAYPTVYAYFGCFPPYLEGVHISYRSPRYIDLQGVVIILDGRHHDDYYLENRSYQKVMGALEDIEEAWERNRPDKLFRYVRRDTDIDVFLDDDYAYTIDDDDYRDMTNDAMDSIDTVSFDFQRIKTQGSNRVIAYGKHVYRDGAYWDLDNRDRHSIFNFPNSRIDRRETVYVTYTLEKRGSSWYISEVGSSRYADYY